MTPLPFVGDPAAFRWPLALREKPNALRGMGAALICTVRVSKRSLAATMLLTVSIVFGGSLDHKGITELLVLEKSFPIGSGLIKGIAFDGSNILAGIQSKINGGISAQLITATGTLAAPRIDLGRTGSPPLVGFNGTNYLLVWADFSDLPSDIFGQFLSRSGEKIGTPFLICADADAAEVGGIDFDGENFFVVWAANTQSHTAVPVIQCQRLSPEGHNLGATLQLNSGVEDQEYPVVAFDGTNHLVCWQQRITGTNLWDVRGRFVSSQGNLLHEFVISEHPALASYPLGIAVGKTNCLVAWSREVGPFWTPEYYYRAYIPTNVWYPMIHGRLVLHSGVFQGGEFQISCGKWRQSAPMVAFDGETFLVSWIDARFGVGSGLQIFWKAFGQKVDASGQLQKAPFVYAQPGGFIDEIKFHNEDDVLATYPSDIGSPLVLVSSGFLAVCYHAFYSNSYGILLKKETDTPPVLRNLRRAQDGTLLVDLDGDRSRKYAIETSTNIVDWSLTPLISDFYFLWPGTTVSLPNPDRSGSRNLFRAVGGHLACVENLRTLRQAKDSWAVEKVKFYSDSPQDNEIFGAGKYLNSKPRCPIGGIYHVDSLQNNPTCTIGTIDGHTL